MEWGMLLWIPIIGGIWLYYRSKTKTKAEFDALPKEGPMKVSITESDVDSRWAKHITCGLDIDVTMSQKDWTVIKKSGLMDKTIFEYPSPIGEAYDPENIQRFPIRYLRGKSSIGFHDVQQREVAKEKLIEVLHTIRARVDMRQEGPQTEQFEI